MVPRHWFYLLFAAIICVFEITLASELTFELPDNAKECFFEEITKNTSATIEFQVVTGGQYDVDVTLTGPKNNVIYQQVKSQMDSHTFKAEITGVYRVCFSNEFSTISHKLIYMDFQVGDEQPLRGIDEHYTALTKVESSAQNIHKSLNSIIDFQTHHRLREAHSRKRAEEINEITLLMSVVVTGAIVLVGIGQVMVLKTFFTDKRSSFK